MIYLLISIGVLLAAGLVVLIRVNRKNPVSSEAEQSTVVADECCGAHEICDSESLLAYKNEFVYYNDEELDAYKGLVSDDYSDDQIEEFRDVLLTLHTDEVAPWLKSLQQRDVNVPAIIREEALIIVTEFREKRHKAI